MKNVTSVTRKHTRDKSTSINGTDTGNYLNRKQKNNWNTSHHRMEQVTSTNTI